MAFQYKLESLLRFQRGLERQEENRLLACVARIAALKTELQGWEQARLAKKQNIYEGSESSVSGAVLQFIMEWDRAASKQEKAIRNELALAEQARVDQVEVYRAARQKREILESLREQQESEYVIEQLRNTQQTLDEAFLMRNFHSRNS